MNIHIHVSCIYILSGIPFVLFVLVIARALCSKVNWSACLVTSIIVLLHVDHHWILNKYEMISTSLYCFLIQNLQTGSKHKGSCTSLPRDYGNRLDMSLLSPPGKDDSDAVFTDDEEIIREQKKKRGLKRFFARYIYRNVSNALKNSV